MTFDPNCLLPLKTTVLDVINDCHTSRELTDLATRMLISINELEINYMHLCNATSMNVGVSMDGGACSAPKERREAWRQDAYEEIRNYNIGVPGLMHVAIKKKGVPG